MSCLVNWVTDAFVKETKDPPAIRLDRAEVEAGNIYLERTDTVVRLTIGASLAGCVGLAALTVTIAGGAIFFGAPLAALAVIGATLGALTRPLLIGAAIITALSFAALAILLLARHQANELPAMRGYYFKYGDGVTVRFPPRMNPDQFKNVAEQLIKGEWLFE